MAKGKLFFPFAMCKTLRYIAPKGACHVSTRGLVASYYDAVKIAAEEISKHNGHIEQQDVCSMRRQECDRDYHIVEGIGYAVGKAASDEKRHTKKERKVLALAGKVDGSSHNQSAAYGQCASIERPYLQAAFKYALGCFLQWHGRAPGHESNNQTAQ